MAYVQSFAPIVNEKTRVLVLGSMPGVTSLKKSEYYGHPQNKFWPIMQEMFGIPVEMPYDERVAALLNRGVGLWDVIGECYRPGSMDSDIREVEVNPLVDLVNQNSSISWILLNGKKALEQFRKNVASDLPSSIQFQDLPSTSPAHARMSFEEKTRVWTEVLSKVGLK